MSQWNYFVTAQRPTAVSHAVGPIAFTGPSETNLIIAKSTRLEVLRLTAKDGGLETICDVPLYGRISILERLRPQGAVKDQLLICTEKKQFCIIGYESDSGNIITHASGDLKDPAGRPVDHLHLCAVDHLCRVAVTHMYEGYFKVIPLSCESTAACEVFNVRIFEQQVLALEFLHDSSSDPVICILHTDNHYARFVSTWLVDVKQRDLLRGPFNLDELESGASTLISLSAPFKGLVTVGSDSVTFFTHHNSIEHRVTASAVSSIGSSVTACKVDEDCSRWLLGSCDDGSLHLMSIRPSNMASGSGGDAYELSLQLLGLTSRPRALAYLGSSYVYVGSAMGDSQLLHLSASKNADKSHFTVIDTHTNLGPILDFCVVDTDDQGQSQVVTCSGDARSGSMRFIRIGMGVNEQGSLEIDGVLGLWSLRRRSNDAGPSLLVLSFIGDTRTLFLSGAGLVEQRISGFDHKSETLHCCEADGDHILQATCNGVRSIMAEPGTLKHQWTPSGGARIEVAASAPNGIIVSQTGGLVTLLKADTSGALSPAASAQLGEVSCLHTRNGFAAVGLWSGYLKILQLSSLQEVHEEILGVDVVPRSVVFAELEGVGYTAVGTGDGRLATHQIDAKGVLSSRKVVVLGSWPIRLTVFRSAFGKPREHIFATGDPPTIIHSTAPGKLLYLAVNLRHLNHAVSFDTELFPGCLAFAAESRLIVGKFDDIQKVHVRTVHLGESPLRICYHQQSAMFTIGCKPVSTTAAAITGTAPSASSSSSSSDVVMTPTECTVVSSIKFVHSRTLEVVQSRALEPQENIGAMCSAFFHGDPTEYLIVGTAFVWPEEPEPSRGRILVYRHIEGSAFTMIFEMEVNGAVYTLQSFQGMLLGSVSNRVSIWKWFPDNNVGRLQLVCGHNQHIIALFLQSMGDYILVGDLMRSAALLLYRPAEGALEEAARDCNPAWLTAVAMLREDLFLCADDQHNVFALERCGETASEEERSKLKWVGQIHTGEFVNRFQNSALVKNPAVADCMGSPGQQRGSDELDYNPVAQMIWVSVDGAVGLVASLRGEKEFARLMQIQEAVCQELSGVGGLRHSEWRDFLTEQKGLPNQGFVDGDLVEAFLDLPKKAQLSVVERLRATGVRCSTVEDLLHEVEELSRMH